MLNPGICCECKQPAAERILIRIIERMSGPSASADACLPCARTYAKTPGAPDWLRRELRQRDKAAQR